MIGVVFVALGCQSIDLATLPIARRAKPDKLIDSVAAAAAKTTVTKATMRSNSNNIMAQTLVFPTRRPIGSLQWPQLAASGEGGAFVSVAVGGANNNPLVASSSCSLVVAVVVAVVIVVRVGVLSSRLLAFTGSCVFLKIDSVTGESELTLMPQATRARWPLAATN